MKRLDAQAVNMIVEMRNTGSTWKQITTALTEAGYRNAFGKQLTTFTLKDFVKTNKIKTRRPSIKSALASSSSTSDSDFAYLWNLVSADTSTTKEKKLSLIGRFL